MSDEHEEAAQLEANMPRQYALPKLVLVEWRRGARRQHAVGFLVADSGSHMVLCDQYDGKHPYSRRLWTIDHGDVVLREEVPIGG